MAGLNRDLYLVVLNHDLDDMPIRLFTNMDDAIQFADALPWSPPQNVLKLFSLPDDSIPCVITIIRFLNGIPVNRFFIRDFGLDDETECREARKK